MSTSRAAFDNIPARSRFILLTEGRPALYLEFLPAR